MSNFQKFKKALQEQFQSMVGHGLYVVGTDKYTLWDTYLDSFPEGTNNIYKERREYDCNCCKQFVRGVGNLVTIIDGEMVSIWDIQVGGYYQPVVDALSKLSKEGPIVDAFLYFEGSAGVDRSHQLLEDGSVKEWDHFHVDIPSQYVNTTNLASTLSEVRSNKEVLKRSLQELSMESAETVLELIDQNSLYRGEEHQRTVEAFLEHKRTSVDLTEAQLDNYCWVTSTKLRGASKIRNTVIGSLLSDLSEGKPLDAAVGSFEAKVAPTNYKRPTALITQGMINKAQDKVKELGIEQSLPRRYAEVSDITVNNILFVDRETKKAMNVFDELSDTLPSNVGNLDKVEEVSIDTFLNQIVPKASSIEVLVKNSHENNFMSLIAPVHEDSPNILKWDNNFCWSYNGEVADSIKDRVKAAGGKVDAVLRCSLSWTNYDDLDISVIEPCGNKISFSRDRNPRTTGYLDIDMNAGGHRDRNAVENITWSDQSKMGEGTYEVIVHNYQKREQVDVGCEVEVEYKGKTIVFPHAKDIRGGQRVSVVSFKYTKANGIEIVKAIPSTESQKEVWSVTTEKFQKVNMIMDSPNHWDGNQTGNKHTFFILEGCKQEGRSRGFFNEFLNEDLTEHRKVFEVLGGKLKTEESDSQLSGLGFSSTQRNQIVVKVTGSFTRTVKVNF